MIRYEEYTSRDYLEFEGRNVALKTVRAKCGSDGIWATPRELGLVMSLGNHVNKSQISKDQFLAFVREHHDADTVAFVEAWIATREPKPLDCVVCGVVLTFTEQGHLSFGKHYGFGLESQQQIVDALTENLRRHGQEVAT